MDDKKLGPGGLVIRKEGRKPLFGTKQTTANEPTRIPPLSRSKSSPGQDKASSPAMTPGSRLPRFGSGGFGSRKPLSLTEAYKLAGEEDKPGPIDGSPSPAPRSWRRLNDKQKSVDDSKMHEAVNRKHVPDASPNKERIAMRNRIDDGIGKSRTSRWVLEEGMRDDAPLPSTENVPPAASPEKSYAWQVDEDFTAGDLQVSDSPRIRVNQPPFTKPTRSPSPRKGATPNAKLEEIRVRELGLTPNVASPRKSKLDEIVIREREAAKQVSLDRGFPRIGAGPTKLDEIKQRETQGLSKRAISQAKLEEIKERNAMTRSVSPDSPRRNWITREGVGIPRSKSAFEPVGRQVPDTPVTIYKSDAERIADEVRRAATKKAEEAAETKNRANRLSPQKRDQSRELLRTLARVTKASPAAKREPDEPPAKPSTAVKQEPLTKPSAVAKHQPRASSLKRSALDARRTSNTSSNTNTSKSTSDRPTVGFAGLARSRSSDSRKSKGSSVHSEQDPTDRIEAEERLFALRDDYSEHGSARAPSPWVDDEGDRTDNDATPKPVSRQDVLAMPTPRAPGAFVDTPVTFKKEDRLRPGSRRMSLEQSPDIKPDLLGDGKRRRDDMARLAQGDVETASDPGVAEQKKKPTRPRSGSLPRRRPPITNSAKPPTVRDDLRDLQRLHNIRDSTLDNLEDILLGKKTTSEKLDALLRETAAIAAAEAKLGEKSELDADLDELAAYEALSASVERDLGVHKDGRIKVEAPLAKTTSQTDETHLNEDEKSSEKIERLNNVLQQQQSENGIKVEDLKFEDKAKGKTYISAKDTKAKDNKAKDSKEKHDHAMDLDCPLCVSQPSTPTVAYLHLPLPRLFHLSPRPRLTLLGLVLCALSLWWAVETAMCGLYCRPTTCSSGPAPCVWSFDDPAGFGAALPVKLDQWATGGRGRAAWAAVREELADALDGVWGAGAVDVQGMTPAQRRRHNRRRAAKSKAPGLSEEQRAKVDAWRKEREARDRGRYVDEGALGGDEPMW
ncbi:hypothetical protein ISF_09755 [Cordyceps fumosorosea ARSEF 2679]|uniref:Uncharacterized protein n=1 Tax=Cordyceps fumosorosea (strain ARSEF 2679) TaxID=1081104 RepID=A0A167D194_CORFA|nr:hypothetical protein ISF_09755 [Cordyceps fumosorosea ARSEF 2679]OAA41827.1 hypothetical protein ISF_09755 [Cordyceps fumosorosea ARSEF 2679]